MSESTKFKTLIVEDEESFLGVLTTVLQSTGRFEITPCESGEQAVQALAREPFDLVILDHKMPGMSGLNVLQWMHEQKLATPVIVLTGAGSENIAVEAMKLGAYDYVRKDQFDRQHFPIIAAGVIERFMFRKERERRDGRLQHEKNLSSLESLHQSISALVLNTNSALATISVITEDCQNLLRAQSESNTQEQLQGLLLELGEEYKTISVTTKTLVELTRLIIDRVAGIASTVLSDKDLLTDDYVSGVHQSGKSIPPVKTPRGQPKR